MTLTQAQKLKDGDRVLWPEGADDCSEAIGVVCRMPRRGAFVQWPDGQRTYLWDKHAIRFIKNIDKEKANAR